MAQCTYTQPGLGPKQLASNCRDVDIIYDTTTMYLTYYSLNTRRTAPSPKRDFKRL